jgi:hypothetical protein
MKLVNIDYRDEHGIDRRVLVPEDDGANPSEGVPLSLDVDSLYEHMPIKFRQQLVKELWARNLIEPADFLRPGAAELIRAALLSVVKRDTMDILNLARERKHD